MKRLLNCLLAVLFLCAVSANSFPAFAQDKSEDLQPPGWWAKLTPFEQFTLVKTRMGEVVSEQAGIKPALQKYLVKYPFTGLGISYEPSVKKEEGVEGFHGVKVVSVWKNSPAANAGIRPGDWLLKVNRYDVCPKNRFSNCIDFAVDAFRSVPTDRPAPIEVEREGQILEFMVAKEPGIGQELVLAIEQFMPDLDHALAAQKQVLNELAETMPEMYDNSGKLYSYFVRLEKMRDFHGAIFTLLSEEEENLQFWEER
ncbi:MAG: PDZ domain-containing protein [bacterium]|nr:PDZ domain-containing protein [bacterium]